MSFLLKVIIILIILSSCKAQEQKSLVSNMKENNSIVGGGCEGCELMYEGMPPEIESNHQSAGWNGSDQKLYIEGTVYHLDGKSPAAGVIIYYWHTNAKGLYVSDEKNTNQSKHGSLRGWIKTGQDGKFSIKTSRPAPYPADEIPAHIHLSVKEPDIDNEYHLDWYFDDDPLYLKHKKIYGRADRGGTEILRLLADGGIQKAEKNIILGLNIPNYPKEKNFSVNSGLSIGEDQPSFIPFHAYGPDKGSRACPVCKYGRYHGIMYFVGNLPDWKETEAWLTFLEQEADKRRQYLKTYFIYGNNINYNYADVQTLLESMGEKLDLKWTALTFVPSFEDLESEVNLNKINPDVRNTFLIYKHRTIIDKAVNLSFTESNQKWITKVLDKSYNSGFQLKEINNH